MYRIVEEVMLVREISVYGMATNIQEAEFLSWAKLR